jgi:sigma-B regulation protein RsbU (phosphoserine phosphatase)
MNQMNTAMSEMNENSIFVTFFIGNLDLKTGMLSYSNAAHCPPVLVNETLSTLQMDANIPLGVMDWDYTRQEIHVGLDSIIFLYTDGLTEAENTTHGQFGEERMLAELEKMADATPRNLIDHISEVIQVFESGTEQSDDLTMLAIRYTKASK